MTTLAHPSDRSEDVAIAIADQNLVGMPAVGMLTHAHRLHPSAKTVLMVDRRN